MTIFAENTIVMKKLLSIIILAVLCMNVRAAVVINVAAASDKEDATQRIQTAIDKAAATGGKKSVILRFSRGTYHIASPGLRIGNMKNVTLDGNGAKLVTHGDITALQIDSCSDITVKNFIVDASDPAVAELIVEARNDSNIVVRPSSTTKFRRDTDGALHWTGENRDFTDGPALLHDGIHARRIPSPIAASTGNYYSKGLIILQYSSGKTPECRAGNVFQLFCPSENPATVLINGSNGIEFENIKFHFSAGIVARYCNGIELKKITCTPEGGTDRTCAGSADFIHLTDCKGTISISECDFNGTHGAAVNIGGTQHTLPAVEVNGCTFTLVPAQALQLSACRRAEIENNTFLNIPAAAVSLSTDAAKISGNTFIDCASPVVCIEGEGDINVSNNEFFFLNHTSTPVIIEAPAATKLTADSNICNTEVKTVRQ